MKKCYFIQDLELAVKKVRLMTEDEFDKYNGIVPEASLEICTFFSHLEESCEFAEEDLREEDVFCFNDGKNIYIRPIIEFEGMENTNLQVGEIVIYHGIMYEILDKNLGISINFITKKIAQLETIEEFLDNL